jgi:DNA-binding LacI/PurR family transcriptional regulator
MSELQTIGLTRKRSYALRNFKALLRFRKIGNGQKLPSERELCEHLAISRGMLRTLLDDLETVGAVRRVSMHHRIVIDPTFTEHLTSDISEGNSVKQVGALEGVIALLGERGIRTDTEDAFRDNANTAAADWEVEQYANKRVIESGYHSLGVQWKRLQADGGRWLLSQRPAGLVALRGVASDVLRQAVKIGIPTVTFGELNMALGVPCVASDHCWGTQALTDHAIAAGAKKILRVWALIGSLDFKRPWLGQRDRGYLQACKEHGIAPLPAVKIPHTQVDDSWEQRLYRNARTIAGYLLEHLRLHGKIDVILATNDAAAFEIAEACRLLDIDPVNDVAIYGYDNSYADHPYHKHIAFTPRMTMDKNNCFIGQTLIDVLLNQPTDPHRVHSNDNNHLVRPTLIDLQR